MNWISKLAATSFELHSLRLRFATELCTASLIFIYNCIRKKTKKAGKIERERERERERWTVEGEPGGASIPTSQVKTKIEGEVFTRGD